MARGYTPVRQAPTLFDMDAGWEEHWVGMPEFVQPKAEEFHHITVMFATEKDMAAFSEVVGQRVRTTTKSMWYPPMSHMNPDRKEWVCDDE